MRDPKTGLCIQCKPDEEGEIIGLVRPDDRGGPEKFQVIFKKLQERVYSRILSKAIFCASNAWKIWSTKILGSPVDLSHQKCSNGQMNDSYLFVD